MTPGQPPHIKKHHRCGASKRLYTYNTIDVPPGPRTRRAAEERRIRISTPAERRPDLWRRNQVQVQTPNKGRPLPGRRRRERNNCVLEKGRCTPPYIGQGGCHPPPLPHVGLSSQGGRCSGKGGGGKGRTPWPQAQGGTPPPLMGPYGPYSVFPLFN